jgi:hypothetical protein
MKAAHPVADLFPMLPDDELAELAADIAERGLLQPIVLDGEGQVLDGRNRLAACEIAGVEPTFTTYEGDDPEGYALAVNLQRRNMTKGQQAVVIARACTKYTDEARRTFGVSKEYVSHANIVLAHAPDLGDAVVSGATSLNEAYEIARRNKEIAESAEAKLITLRTEAPDLAELVAEERITLATAITELQARDAQAESVRRAATANLNSVLLHLTSAALTPYDLAVTYFDVLADFKQDDLDYAVHTMTAIATMKRDL